MDNWLSRNDIITIASEFLSQEYSDRIKERVFYIHSRHIDSGLPNDLLDKIIKIIEHYRDYFDERILYYKEPVKFENIVEEGEIYRKSIMSKPLDNYVPPKKTDEYIIQLRETYKIPRVTLIGKYVTGVRGEINRNEVDRILQQVIEAKNNITNDKASTQEQSLQIKDKNQEIKSLSDLLGDNLDEYIRMLKKVLADDNKYPIDTNGRWTKKVGDYSILIAWMDALRQAGKFKDNSISDRKKSELLNIQFPGIDFKVNDTSIWRKSTEKSHQYKERFDKKLK